MRTHEEVHTMLEPRFAASGFCGFHPPAGWLDLILEIDTHLAATNPDYRIVQIKEKFGGLRYYTDGVSEKGREYVRNMYERSLGICQNCGNTNNVAIRRHGWVATLCEQCDQADNARGYRYLD